MVVQLPEPQERCWIGCAEEEFEDAWPPPTQLAALTSLLTSGLWHFGQRTVSISSFFIRSSSKQKLQLVQRNSWMGMGSFPLSALKCFKC